MAPRKWWPLSCCISINGSSSALVPSGRRSISAWRPRVSNGVITTYWISDKQLQCAFHRYLNIRRKHTAVKHFQHQLNGSSTRFVPSEHALQRRSGVWNVQERGRPSEAQSVLSLSPRQRTDLIVDKCGF